jgi:hypothetical protein
MKFLRYESPAPNQRGAHIGIFGLANGLRSDGRLQPADLRWLHASNAWGDAAYPDPAIVDPTIFDKTVHPLASCWFKTTATVLVDQARGYLDLLDRYGVPWIERSSDAPGRVIYEDLYQVVVVPG